MSKEKKLVNERLAVEWERMVDGETSATFAASTSDVPHACHKRAKNVWIATCTILPQYFVSIMRRDTDTCAWYYFRSACIWPVTAHATVSEDKYTL